MKTVVFLGGGRITSALIAGLRLAHYEATILVHDRHPRKLQQLKRQYKVNIEEDVHRAVKSAGILLIAVRPDSVRGLLKEIKPDIERPLTVVSLAAGVPLAKLQARLGSPVRWARAMPSPICRSGRGLTALAFSRGISSAERAEVRKLFAAVGAVLEIPEQRFDAFTVTFSSSHGYHALATLMAAAERVGLDRKTARMAAAHALADAIGVGREGNAALDELLEEAATPGGTAAAVMASMRKGGYARMLEQGLRAGIKQAKRNAAR